MEEQMEEQSVNKVYFEYLAEQGYRPVIDEDGDIRFKSEGFNLYIVINEKRPDFFQLLCPAFWALESQQERQQATNVALMTSREVMATKLYIANDNVFAAIEQYVETPEQACAMFEKLLAALMTGVRDFGEKMRSDTFELAS